VSEAALLAVLWARLPYVGAVTLVAVGLFVLVDDRNLVKKVIGLNVFQTGIFLFLVVSAVREGGRSPTVVPGADPATYVNPLPQVLVLTAIVVEVSVTAVALALVVRVYESYGTLRADLVREAVAADGEPTADWRAEGDPEDTGGEVRPDGVR
jgi:multicomponent Na+:H+ antiporter subunit C